MPELFVLYVFLSCFIIDSITIAIRLYVFFALSMFMVMTNKTAKAVRTHNHSFAVITQVQSSDDKSEATFVDCS